MNDNNDKRLPQNIKQGDDVLCIGGEVKAKQTSPPNRFTPGTIIEAMDKVHNFVKSPEIKKQLKETSGIGTEATRAGIIETLIQRKFVEKKGKNLISTDLGRKVVDHLPAPVRDPGTTALWEDFLKHVESGKTKKEDFLKQQAKMLDHLINDIASKDMSQMSSGDIFKCPECDNALKRHKSKNKKNTFYWVCFNSEGHKNNKPVFRPDRDNKPVMDI